MSCTRTNVATVEVYGDTNQTWSVLVENGPDVDTLAPVDLTGYTMKAEVRDDLTDTVITEWVLTIGNQADPLAKGWIVGRLNEPEIAALRAFAGADSFRYDLRIVSPADDVLFPIVESRINLRRAVTSAV